MGKFKHSIRTIGLIGQFINDHLQLLLGDLYFELIRLPVVIINHLVYDLIINEVVFVLWIQSIEYNVSILGPK